ncbi:MAG: octanoyltransferase [SAR86 cluster bacterium]|uniref:Octanoyltransferase n=1 Tax=SAR86 cluster bacterium TaxID=2030880 RepID=A0A2A4MEW1_9GAMM|nr:MAG: octanoyltransferase [SAR86 cluster bacterium]
MPAIIVRRLGLQDYQPIYKSMRYLAKQLKRANNSGASVKREDEIWLLSHKPVYTLGQAGKPEHILNPGQIPVESIDRGGQVTYHGPGQLVAYLLLDMKQRGLGARDLVSLIESAIIDTLKQLGINSATKDKAPGVYVDGAKIAALGLRIKNGRSYHGLSLNVQMDLSPFEGINPCGFEDLKVTQVADQLSDCHQLMPRVSRLLANNLLLGLGYTQTIE